MSDDKIARRLAAILAADVVGYSRMVGIDEEGTIKRLNALRTRLWGPSIERHGGRLVKTMGDGFLIEYPSAVDAVRNAIELQNELLTINADLPPDRRLEFRIGVNLGDIVAQDDDIFGDGVNIAARLESIAVPGGVCISEKVATEVDGKIETSFLDGGASNVKNIAQPVHVRHWHPDDNIDLPVVEASKGEDATGNAGGKPTLAILPFESLSEGTESENLTAMVEDEISAAVSKLTGIDLITVPEDANYLAKGSVRAVGDRFRVTIQLHDQVAHQQFWCERFDGTLEDIFEAVDALVARVLSTLRYEIYERETEKSKSRPIEEQSNQELMGQAGHILFQCRRAEYEKSRSLISVVVERDPNNPMALAIRAWGLAMLEVVCGWGPIAPEDGENGIKLIRRSVELNERSDFAHFVLGHFLLQLERNPGAAIREAERCLQLNSSYALAMGLMCDAMCFAGNPEAGIGFGTRAVETDAHFPANNLYMDGIALGNFVRGNYQEAVEWSRRSDQLQRNVPKVLLMLTSASAHLGQMDAAHEEARRLIEMSSDIRVSSLRRWPFQDPQQWERFTEGLVAAGIPA
jgi:class 3 adenylate cyclase/TolB-like protein